MKLTKDRIESIIGSTDELAIRDINEVLERDANPATWKLTSITIGHVETATTARKPVRMTEKQAEAIIEASKETEKPRVPTTEELEANFERLVAKYNEIFEADYHKDKEAAEAVASETETETEAETEAEAHKAFLGRRAEAHKAYREAREAFETYADGENPDYAEVQRLHKAKQNAHKAYREVQ